MRITKLAGCLLGGLLFVLTAPFLGSQEVMKHDTNVKKPPIPYSNPQSGEQMYKDYCAACHGPAGKGDGPAAAFLKSWPPDLTTMTQRNQGKYPELKVREALLFGTSSHAHGTSDMPVWGPLFRSEDPNQKQSKERVSKLTSYLQSLQRK